MARTDDAHTRLNGLALETLTPRGCEHPEASSPPFLTSRTRFLLAEVPKSLARTNVLFTSRWEQSYNPSLITISGTSS